MKKVLSLCLLSVLSGCATEKTEDIKCPKIVIAADLGKAVMFDPKGGAPLLRTEMDSIRPRCDLTRKNVEIEMLLRMTSFRKKGTTTPIHGTVSYFVAILDMQDNILKTSSHDVKIDLDEKKSNKISLESIQETIPNTSYEHLKIVVGFHLSDDQVKFNQELKKKRLAQHP